ncbi:hypothetical protein ScPMuIL_012463 [Solemya velum]
MSLRVVVSVPERLVAGDRSNYSRKRRRISRFHGLPLRYEKRPLTSIDFSLLESKINDPHLQGSQARLRTSVTDIATSSILSRRNRIALAGHDGGGSDMKFFAELVKPMQYKWRRDNDRVLVPSKHGYHPRSQSPTFKRLIEVTEKLAGFAEPESELERLLETRNEPEADSGLGSLTGNREEITNKSLEHLERLNELRIEALRVSRSEPCYGRDIREITSSGSGKKSKEGEKNEASDFFEYDKLKAQHKDAESSEEDDAASTTDSNYQPLSMEDYFKVDFRVQKSHAELHLFLPHIDGRSSQIESRASDNAKHNACKLANTSRLKLPSIDMDELGENSPKGTPSVTSRKSKKDAKKKKKKTSTSRAKSAEHDKEIKDRLNDVPTLISIENEKSHVHHGICPFDPCAYHSKMQKNDTALT